jgi:hypothetical protein
MRPVAPDAGRVRGPRLDIAASLRESRRVERALANRGIDFVVEVEMFQSRLLGVIPRVCHGAAACPAPPAYLAIRRTSGGADNRPPRACV